MFIDTTQDVNFDPTKSGMPLPPVGVYSNLTLKIIESADSETKNKEAKIDITFEVIEGSILGTQFKLTYNVGHSNAIASRIAREGVIALAAAITGDVNIHKSGSFNFDYKMYNRPFIGTLTIKNQDTLDSNGNSYRQGNLSQVKPLAGQPQNALVQNYQAQPQNMQVQQGIQPAGQPQTTTAPWGNRG